MTKDVSSKREECSQEQGSRSAVVSPSAVGNRFAASDEADEAGLVGSSLRRQGRMALPLLTTVEARQVLQ